MSEKRAAYRRFAIYSSIIFALPTTLIGALYLGYLLDKRFDTSPWLTLAGMVLGIAGAFIQLFQLLKPELRKGSEKK